MLHHITWHQYLTASFVIAVVYYLWIIIRCYQSELRKLAGHLKNLHDNNALAGILKYQEPEAQVAAAGQNLPPEAFPAGTEDITAQLKAVIQAASGKPYAPAALMPLLKKTLQAFPDISASPYRQAINELVVQECEKTGTALLTEDEVDQWWVR
jgi:hypothetical protein